MSSNLSIINESEKTTLSYYYNKQISNNNDFFPFIIVITKVAWLKEKKNRECFLTCAHSIFLIVIFIGGSSNTLYKCSCLHEFAKIRSDQGPPINIDTEKFSTQPLRY